MNQDKKNTQGKDKIDTDNDGKLRNKGDTSDHGDPKSPYGNKNTQQGGKDAQGKDKIDTDNDGKLRNKGDTSDHGDPKSPYGNKNTQQGGQATDKKPSTPNSK